MRVLLAADGSKDAVTATEWLKTFPLPEDATVLVLTVAALPITPVEAETMKNLREAVLADARRVNEEALKRIESCWPGVDARVSEGDARHEIVRTAEEWKADLVVIGARGLGAVKGFLLGSVSRGVARHAPCPVLVVKGEPRRLQSAVVAVDGSDDSLHALRFFAPLARGLKVRLLYVIEQLHFPSSAPRLIRARIKGALTEFQRERKAEAGKTLRDVAAGLEGKVKSVKLSIPVGVPGEEIVRAANEQGVGLVVVGARGLGAVTGFFLGSVSEKVLLHAKCPVLIVKRLRGGRGGGSESRS